MNKLNNKTQDEALKYARNALRAYWGMEKLLTRSPHSPTLWEKRGVFVTLTRRGKLRGCIGEIETDLPIYRLIQELAVASATRDWRFAPVTKDELDSVDIEISVLTKPKKIADWRKITLGKHGVIIERDGRKGVFLPQVTEDKEWTLEEFLSTLCTQKAGLPADAYIDPLTALHIFEIEKIVD